MPAKKMHYAHGIHPKLNAILTIAWYKVLQVNVMLTKHAYGTQVPLSVLLRNANDSSRKLNAKQIQHAHGMDINVVSTRPSNVQLITQLQKLHQNLRLQKYQLSKLSSSDKLNV